MAPYPKVWTELQCYAYSVRRQLQSIMASGPYCETFAACKGNSAVLSQKKRKAPTEALASVIEPLVGQASLSELKDGKGGAKQQRRRGRIRSRAVSRAGGLEGHVTRTKTLQPISLASTSDGCFDSFQCLMKGPLFICKIHSLLDVI